MLASLFYYIAPILCYFTNYIKEFKQPLYKNFLFIILAIFICGGYMVGSDWRAYETIYYELKNGGVGNIYWAPGYLLLNKFFIFLGFDFWTFFVLLKFALFFSLIYLIYYFSSYPLLALGLFISKSAYYLFIDNPMRNLIALVLIGYSLVFFLKRKKIISLIFAFFAVMFHYASFLYILLLPIAFYLKNKSLKTIIISMIILCFIVSFHSLMINTIIKTTQMIIGWTPNYFSLGNIRGTPEKGAFFKVIIRLAFLFPPLLFFRKKVSLCSIYGDLLFGLSCVYCITFVASRNIPILFRINMFFEIFIIIYFLECLRFFKKNNYSLILGIILVVSIYFVNIIITKNCYMIPYSNVIYYRLIGEDLSFGQRSEYNLKNSPIRIKSRE